MVIHQTVLLQVCGHIAPSRANTAAPDGAAANEINPQSSLDELEEEFDDEFELELLDELDEEFEFELLEEFDERLELELLDELDELFELRSEFERPR